MQSGEFARICCAWRAPTILIRYDIGFKKSGGMLRSVLISMMLSRDVFEADARTV